MYSKKSKGLKHYLKSFISFLYENSQDSDFELNIDSDSNILVVAPHPDDESLGCGGLLCKYSKQCDVLLVTDGGTGNPEWTYDFTVKTRADEFVNAMNWLAVKNYTMMGCLSDSYKTLKQTKIDLNLLNYNYIFIPGRNENHPEHKIVNQLIRKACKKQKYKSKLFEYEVWTPLNKISHSLDIGPVIEKKRNLIGFYKCQLKHVDYVSGILGLNSYRGIQRGKEYSECYYQVLSSTRLAFVFFSKILYNILHIFICFLHR